MSVRWRVTIASAGLFAIALGLAAFFLVRSVHDNLAEEIERTNVEQLEDVAEQVAAGTDPNDVQIPLNRGPGSNPVFQVYGPDGRNVIGGGGPRPPQGGPGVTARRTVETAAGTITLVAERSLDSVDDTVDEITRALFLGVPILVALMAGLTWWFAGRALRPVESIRAEADEITGSSLHRRVPEPGTKDEVGRLARTMNSMLDRLEDSSTRQRRFVSDASHELRSPVASIRAQLEVALRRGEDADWPDVARKVLEEDERLADAVTELLELARAEEGEAFEMTDVDLDEVVLTETTVERRVPIDTSRVSAGRVRGSTLQLARVVRNLLENACRHAESKVELSLGTEGDEVVLVVDDDGPGIAPEDRERIFDRFTRLDEGRARDAGGIGLGLAMVEAIVERHGGSVSVDTAPAGGARFVTRLPSA